MKLIYICIPISLSLFASCKQSSPQASSEESGTVTTPTKESTVKNPSETPETKAKVDSEVKSEAENEANPKEEKPVAPKSKKDVKGDDRYLGLSQEEALALAKKEKQPARVISVDGDKRMVTMDFRPERLNFIIVAGKVTKVTRG